MGTIFTSSSKSYSTFNKDLQEKKIIILSLHSKNVSFSFAHIISSDEESNVSYVTSTSEHKNPSVSHFFPSETEDIAPSSETSSLSSYPPFTSSFKSSFEN